MRSRRVAAVATSIGVLAASQVGHLLASELRQGPRALVPANAGAHAYAPTLTTVVLGITGGFVLAALLIVAAARAGRARPAPGAPRPRRSSVLDLVAVLFVLQLAIFLGQETIEAAAGGLPLRDAGDLVLWGCLGQLPVAFVAGLVLSPLTARLEAAVEELAGAAGQPLAPRAVVAAVQALAPARAALRPGSPAGASSQRGPPSLPRLHPIEH